MDHVVGAFDDTELDSESITTLEMSNGNRDEEAGDL